MWELALSSLHQLPQMVMVKVDSGYQGSGWLPWDQVASCPTGRLCTNGCSKATAQVPLQMLGLQKLLLSGIGGVRDEMVTELAMLLGSSLEELHLLVL
ncbi:unnamed protein product [Sphagnum compactum]